MQLKNQMAEFFEKGYKNSFTVITNVITHLTTYVEEWFLCKFSNENKTSYKINCMLIHRLIELTDWHYMKNFLIKTSILKLLQKHPNQKFFFKNYKNIKNISWVHIPTHKLLNYIN